MELKKIRPDIPVILCTGFSKKIADGRTINVKPDKILMKPVLKDDLLTTIREIFDSRSDIAMEYIQYHAS
jgi:DNA-binding NarL/FixJ family response regulator